MRNMGLDIITAARSYGDAVALRHKRNGKYIKYTYHQMAEIMDQLAAGLVEQGVRAGDRVGIFSPNLPEWLMADYAILSVRAVTVPIYATNTTDQMRAIVEDSGMRMLLVGTEEEYERAGEVLATCPALERLVIMDESFQPGDNQSISFAALRQANPSSRTLAEIEARRAATAAGDLATIIYTSGTTGQPKGAQLSHGNFVNQHTTLDSRFDVGSSDSSLCFLPLSHVYERSWSAYVHLAGATNVILSDPKQVIVTLAEVRPTVMVSAPRLYEKVYSAVLAKAESSPPLRRKIFFWALEVGHEYWTAHYTGTEMTGGLKWRYWLADKLVLTKIRNVVGGPKNFFSSGGAPLDRKIEEFFLKVGLLICQGYGLTETAPMLTCNSPGDFKFGTVGRPIDDVEIRIADTGEIQAKGPNVTIGYFGLPEANAEAFTEGWFRTGDIGHLDEDGFLVITDRIKDLIVTSGGKNVAPQRIETMVGKDFYIDQLAVLGDKRKFISAIIVPSFENLREFAAQKKLQFQDHDELIRLPEVVELFNKRIKEHSGNLAPFEKIKKFTLVPKQFSQAAGEITPTLKVKRKVIADKYHQMIERMYSSDPADKDDQD